MPFDFTLVDVFSDRPFGGNQLAVFPDAEGIDEETMQRLAREFNFSETSFVLPPRDPAHTHRVRIFTPHQELPFAGHPTVGTAAVLAGDAFVFEEGIGPVSVTVEGPMIRLHLHDPAYETTDAAPPVAAIARALGVPEDGVAEAWYGSVGVGFCFVRLADAGLVDRAALDKAAWQAGVADGWSSSLFFFSEEEEGRLYARMFAPSMGIDEDPATGAACASLVASLAHRSLPEATATLRLRIDQGVAMGRASVIHATARTEGGRLAEVTVGGNATVVGHGTMTL